MRENDSPAAIKAVPHQSVVPPAIRGGWGWGGGGVVDDVQC